MDNAILFALSDAEVAYTPNFLAANSADHYLQQLTQSLQWRQDKIQLFGREVTIPRLQAWYGDPELSYRYSGLTLRAPGWTEELEQLKQQIEQYSGYTFNAVLANLYRDGRDSVGWHADNEPELGKNPVIASLSLGQTRRFKLRHRHDPSLKQSIELEHGSLLLMSGPTQHYWQHALPKSARPLQARINLTFRQIR